MPKIEEQPEEEKEPEDTGEDERPQVSMPPKSHDKASEAAASSILNRMFSVESEEMAEEEIPVVLQSSKDSIELNSDGESDHVVSVFPVNPNSKYMIEIQDNMGNVISTIPNIQRAHRARLKMIKGDYKVVVRSERGDDKFNVKID